MAGISGTLRVGEAGATAGAICARQQGSQARFIAIQIGLIFCGLVAGLLFAFLTSGKYPSHYVYCGAIGAGIGMVIYAVLARHFQMRQFKQNFQDRHQTLDLPLRIEIAGQHLIYEVGGITQHADWAAVDELFQCHGYWIFLAQSHPMHVPKRLFANEGEEKRFVADALSRMEAGAQARSADARHFMASAN